MLPIVLLALGLAACDSGSGDLTLVDTEQGSVSGVSASGMRVFRGIPYAAPPVGERRWRPPQPPADRDGVLDAAGFAAHCPQPPTPYGLESATEDCLYLNVYAPEEDGPHPVMVWIHGGALVVGESDAYDPAPLVARDVVVVTVNYRLGILGYLAHPALSAESPAQASGDYGMMDQIAALEWVRDNIAGFGGNPDNVTIFGESAGARSVLYLMVSPAADGLFHKAILQSGSGFDSLRQATLAEKEAGGEDFAGRVGCADRSAACLRALPVADILASQGQTIGPNLRPDLFPRQVGEALRTGVFNEVPVMLGTNHNEWRIFVGQQELATGQPLTAGDYVPAIAGQLRIPPAAAPVVAGEYPLADYASPGLALSAAATDGNQVCRGRTLAGLLAPRVATYAYEFRDFDAPQRFLPPASFEYGAYHAAEIQYLFELRAPIEAGLDQAQRSLSDAMVRYWTRFARSGDPNAETGTLPFWPRYTADADTYLVLDTPAPVTSGGIAEAHQCDFWDAFLAAAD